MGQAIRQKCFLALEVKYIRLDQVILQHKLHQISQIEVVFILTVDHDLEETLSTYGFGIWNLWLFFGPGAATLILVSKVTQFVWISNHLLPVDLFEVYLVLNVFRIIALDSVNEMQEHVRTHIMNTETEFESRIKWLPHIFYLIKIQLLQVQTIIQVVVSAVWVRIL